MSIKHNKQFLSLINDLTPISNSVIINKTDNQVKITRANSASTVFYTLEAAKDAFDFDGEKIAFYEFAEFYQLLNVFENAEISLNENKLTISSDKSKIRYIISDPETIKAGPSQILFQSSDAKVVLESNEIKNFKKMIGLIKAKFIKFTVKDKNINFRCFNDAHDNSYEKNFPIENESDFSMKISSEVFTLIPDNKYVLEICKDGLVKISYEKDNIKLAVYVAEIED